jgi:phosphoribosyl-AMP cyclohydrolase
VANAAGQFLFLLEFTRRAHNLAAMFSPRTDKKTIEEGLGFSPKFDKDGLIVAIAQDAATGEVLMVAYMNEESLKLTLQLGEAVYYSRSRQEIWHKGKTSGHVQKVREIRTDCDQDALVVKVEQLGEGACHTGFRSCFYRRVHRDATLQQCLGEKTFDASKVYGTK